MARPCCVRRWARSYHRKSWRRRKRGFRVPFNQWFRGPHADLVRELLCSNASEVARLCERTAVHRFVDEHISGKHNHEKILWSLANLEMFLRTFKPSGVETHIRPGGLKKRGRLRQFHIDELEPFYRTPERSVWCKRPPRSTARALPISR